MKKKDFQDLRNKKVVELEKIVTEKKQESVLADEKMKTGQEKKIKKVKNLRREIAQILTIIREKQILEEEGKKEAKNNTKSK